RAERTRCRGAAKLVLTIRACGKRLRHECYRRNASQPRLAPHRVHGTARHCPGPRSAQEMERHQRVSRAGFGECGCTRASDAKKSNFSRLIQEAIMFMHRRRTAAFTLVELIVVIGVVLLLMAALMGAMPLVREAMNKTTCRNNLKQLA